MANNANLWNERRERRVDVGVELVDVVLILGGRDVQRRRGGVDDVAVGHDCGASHGERSGEAERGDGE